MHCISSPGLNQYIQPSRGMLVCLLTQIERLCLNDGDVQNIHKFILVEPQFKQKSLEFFKFQKKNYKSL